MRKPPINKSFYNAFRGIFMMVRTERNFQIEVAALVINIALIISLDLNSFDAALILLFCVVVLSAEIFNTAIEKICDTVQPEYDERIRFIKDISAGAVLLLAISSVIAAMVIYPKYLSVAILQQ